MRLKNLASLFLLFILLGISPVLAYGVSPNFYLYPSNGTIADSSKGFTVDVLLESAGESITSARFAIRFDPTQIQVTKASKNNSLFDQWPEDESTIDNGRGMVMLTGFTQSGGSKSLYITDGDPDVMARLEFEVITEEKEDIVLTFEHSGIEELFKSSIMTEGSPPQNVLLSRPSEGIYTLSGFKSPSTAIDPSHIGIVVGLVLIGIGLFVTKSKVSLFSKKRGTIVFYE